MRFSQFFKEMDDYLKNNLNTLTCHEIFEIKEDFYKTIDLFCGSTSNLTGITEYIIFRVLYHALQMENPIENKSVHRDNIYLRIGNRYIGKNGKYQEPDIVVEEGETIKYLLSIKNKLSTITANSAEKENQLVKDLILKNGVYTTSIQDIFRIDNVRHGDNRSFRSLTIIFSKVNKKHETTINIIHQTKEWHRFLILEENHNSFLSELENKINFQIKACNS